MVHHLHDRLNIALPVDRVFSFFADAANLERITPPELTFRIVTPPPIRMGTGTRIDYKLGLFGLGFTWRAEIRDWDPPHRFVDVQLRGPYREWVHTHTFTPTPEGTRIEDHVRYQLPLTPLGDVAWPLIRIQLSRIFAYRQKMTRQLLLAEAGVPSA